MLSIPTASPLKPRGKSGPKPKDKPIVVPLTQDLHLNEQSREKQAEYVRTNAYQLCQLFGRDLFKAFRDNNKTGIKEQVISYGILADKLLSGVESSGIDLHIPAALIDKFALALNVKQTAPLPVDTNTER